jgi:hypothetical protein
VEAQPGPLGGEDGDCSGKHFGGADKVAIVEVPTVEVEIRR